MTYVCPFCKSDPYHYVDIGVGYERVAVVCCEEGIEYFSPKLKTGLDDGPPLPRHVINGQKKDRALSIWKEGKFSARQIALLVGLSHDTIARLVRNLKRDSHQSTD